MNDAQKFTELTGGCRHVRTSKYSAICRKCKADICSAPSISYDNAADILNRMKEYCGEERYFDFMVHLGSDVIEKTNPTPIGLINNFLNDYILDTPALCKKAVEFLKGDGK
jgi:hypothetical protein